MPTIKARKIMKNSNFTFSTILTPKMGKLATNKGKMAQ